MARKNFEKFLKKVLVIRKILHTFAPWLMVQPSDAAGSANIFLCYGYFQGWQRLRM